MNNEADIDTQFNFPIYRDEVANNPPTEKIPAYAPPMVEQPAPPADDWNLPPKAVPVYASPPVYDRKRGGMAALALAMLLLGGFIGYLAFSFTAAKQLDDYKADATSISTKKATVTATATATKIKTVTESPLPAPTVTKTQKIKVQGDTKTVKKASTPASCLSALRAAEQYMALAKRGGERGNGRRNMLLREARGNFWYWSDQCQGDKH